jgi:Tfp pilus assembly protein PilW
MSSLPAVQLPRSMKRGGVKTVCAVESVISDSDMKLKNRHWCVAATDAKMTTTDCSGTTSVPHTSALSLMSRSSLVQQI